MEKDKVLEKLIELSFKTEDKFVTPLIISYFRFENSGANQEGALNLVENMVLSYKS